MPAPALWPQRRQLVLGGLKLTAKLAHLSRALPPLGLAVQVPPVEARHARIELGAEAHECRQRARGVAVNLHEGLSSVHATHRYDHPAASCKLVQ